MCRRSRNQEVPGESLVTFFSQESHPGAGRSACIKGAVGAQSPHFGERRGVHRRCGPSQMDPQGPLAKKRETCYNKRAVYNFLKKEKADPEGRTLCPKGRRPVPGPRALTIRLMEESLPSRPSLSIANFFGRKESIEEQIL